LDGIATTKARILPGLDIRGEGGYVVAPPSYGYGGSQYRFVKGRDLSLDLAPVPEWVFENLLNTSSTTNVKAPYYTGTSLGGRHDALVRFVSAQFNQGKSQGDVKELVRAWNDQNNPPFSQEELTQELDGILRYWSSGKYLPHKLQEYVSSVSSGLDTIVPVSEFMSAGSDEISWMIPQLIPHQTVTMLGGMRGIGKSWVMLDLALEACRGGKWLGTFDVTKGPVIYSTKNQQKDSFATALRSWLTGRTWT
jgi:hypothetical protein